MLGEENEEAYIDNRFSFANKNGMGNCFVWSLYVRVYFDQWKRALYAWSGLHVCFHSSNICMYDHVRSLDCYIMNALPALASLTHNNA